MNLLPFLALRNCLRSRQMNIIKHTHAVRAEPMTCLAREFGLRSERVVDGVDGL